MSHSLLVEIKIPNEACVVHSFLRCSFLGVGKSSLLLRFADNLFSGKLPETLCRVVYFKTIYVFI